MGIGRTNSSNLERIKTALASNVPEPHLCKPWNPRDYICLQLVTSFLRYVLVSGWRDRQAMAPMGFIVSLELYVFPERHVYLIAERDGEIVGLLSAVPVFRRNGWFVEDLIRMEQAPNGTNELLVNAFFALAREEGAEYVTLGLVPLAGPLSFPLRIARSVLQPFFHFSGLEHFKEKLHPKGHEPRYIVGANGAGRLRNLIDVLSAFSRVGFLRFAVISLSRGPRIAIQGLTILLVIWLIALARVPTDPWFPSRAVQEAWCLFDLGLAAGLIALCRRFRRGLALTLAMAISWDTAVTFYEAVTFNVPRVRGIFDGLALLTACLGPLMGATLLWGAIRRTGSLHRRFKKKGV